jgi:hypothetical protein
MSALRIANPSQMTLSLFLSNLLHPAKKTLARLAIVTILQISYQSATPFQGLALANLGGSFVQISHTF